MKLSVIISEELSSLFEASLSDIHQKYYKAIPEDVFEKIVLSDPTSQKDGAGKPSKLGKYSQWLLRLFLMNRLELEDLYKATDYLTVFHKYKASDRIKIKNIDDIRTLPDLFANIKAQYEAVKTGAPQTKGEVERFVKEKETKKVYEDERWLVVIPLTHRSACYYGKNTQWCTASNDDDSHFKSYTSRGPLYINIDKQNNTKYQFHLQDGQFMDETDRGIDIYDLFASRYNAGLRKFYVKEIVEDAKKNGKTLDVDYTFDIMREGDNCYLEIEGGWEGFAKYFPEKLRSEFIEDILRGDGRDGFYVDTAYIDVDNYSDMIDENNMNTIRTWVAENYGDEIEEDIFEIDEIKTAIKNAAANSEEQAAEDQAYSQMTDAIIAHFGIINTSHTEREVKDHKTGGTQKKSYFRFQIQPNVWENLVIISALGKDEYGDTNPLAIDYESPYYGYHGEVKDEDFNEQLASQLSSL